MFYGDCRIPISGCFVLWRTVGNLRKVKQGYHKDLGLIERCIEGLEDYVSGLFLLTHCYIKNGRMTNHKKRGFVISGIVLGILQTLRCSSADYTTAQPEINSTLHYITNATVSNSSTTVTTPSQQENVQCINNYGECISQNDTCPGNRAKVSGICNDADQFCCIATPDERVNWKDDDKDCLTSFGTCILQTKICSGKFDSQLCGGTKHRKCCVPSNEEKASWKEKDKVCMATMGACQVDLYTCDGTYQANTCGGPEQRKCCLPKSEVREEWKRHDSNCDKNWGTCQYKNDACSGKYENGICGGPDQRQCCVPDENAMKEWKNTDKKCQLKLGSCQRKTTNCSGSYNTDSKEILCGGPDYRRCCIPDLKNVESWKADDKKCTDKGGICQSVAMKCGNEYLPGLCGGPQEVRQCCTVLVKQGNPQSGSKGSKDEKARSTIDKLLHDQTGRTVTLAISIPATFFLLVGLFCLVRKRRDCCKPYRTLRGDPKNMPWYKMEYNEMDDDDEGVNLTTVEENKTYA